MDSIVRASAAHLNSDLGDDLLWRSVRSGRRQVTTGALFVDRDGVLVREKVYLSKASEVELVGGAVDLLSAATKRGIPIVVVTNQAGIAKGRLTWPDFFAVEQRITQLLSDLGLSLDAVFACPFHEDGSGIFRVADHPWRKPNPGMLEEASRLLNLDLSQSLLVGDKTSDILAAKNAGMKYAIQVLTGHGLENVVASAALASESFDVVIGDDPSAAIPHLERCAQ